ncbi:endo alpha-1,4 polygalactosaminidase [Meiothermus hypogaeus]|uniref:Endo alpha-1,4 polygalactosaminidase n=2 Tax=Meiothermus hypogaeus TaxID=884155 RepID=A0A511R5K2_9DEIN|nr:endo alpha-1,4 polygalactosaminidase [Meiothermus hypogaeus]GEM84899.1 endo alpha-1,4 polygalactosaminidase [Meiothermus hypogaeus NBRC 106114]
MMLLMLRYLWILAIAITACGSTPEVTTPTPPSPTNPSPPANPTPPATPGSWWKPAANTTWHIQYTGTLDKTRQVTVYNVDLFDTPASVVQELAARGVKAVCYLSAGSWENWRPDKNQFPPEVLGRNYDGWPGERWLDIRQIDKLAPVLRARLDLCKQKGFVGVDPDNVNGYQNNTGFPLTAQDQIRFNRWLANEAHQRGLAIGLKNTTELLSQLINDFDFLVTEECFDQGWCNQTRPMVQAGKPVLNIEYTDTRIKSASQFCGNTLGLGIFSILKRRELDGWVEECR